MPVTYSADGTSITYEQTGQGPLLVLVNGALASRNYYGEAELAKRLSDHFTVIYYDRRGRGDSTDILPYSVDKEIADISALIQLGAGRGYLYGCSSGAALAMSAAAQLGPGMVLKLAVYEPPFTPDRQRFDEGRKRVSQLIDDGKPADAVTAFMQVAGSTPEALAEMRQSPDWKKMVELGPTLAYDYAVLGDGDIPLTVTKQITIPALVLTGDSPMMHATADTLAKMIPGASRKTLGGQPHTVAPGALAPVLIDFFS